MLASILLAVGSHAAPALEEMRTRLVRPLPGRDSEFGVSILPLDDDFLIGGYAKGDSSDAAILLRVGPTGDEIWRRPLACGGDGAVWSLCAIGDGTFVGAGWTRAAADELDAMLVRFDASGKVLWQTAYAGTDKERLWSVVRTPAGLLAAGESLRADGSCRAVILRTDLDGREASRQFAGDAPVERVFSVQAVEDGGCVLAGLAGSGPREGPGYDARIARYDAAGKLVWSRSFGGAGFDVAHDLRALADGGFLAAGYTNVGDSRVTDAFLLRLSPGGEIEWSKTYGGPGDDRAVHLATLPGGGSALVGYSGSPDERWDIVVRALSKDGDLLLERRFGGAGNELGRSIAVGKDGGLVVLGHSGSYGPKERILLIRLDA